MRLGAGLRSGEGIEWLAAGTILNSLYRVPFFYLFLACALCYCFFLLIIFCFVFVFMYACMVITCSRIWINRVRLPKTLLVVS